MDRKLGLNKTDSFFFFFFRKQIEWKLLCNKAMIEMNRQTTESA